MIFLDIFKHLLPRARAWSITVQKDLRKFWDALTVIGDAFKFYADKWVYDARFADRTELLDQWINEFGLSLSTTLTPQERRERLIARWKETGGQSPYYLQTTLQNAGFNVYVFDWWLPGYDILCGSPNARCGYIDARCGHVKAGSHHGQPRTKNPFDYLRRTYLPKGDIISCGDPLARCGNPVARCGNTDEKLGYPLVNKIDIARLNYIITCGLPKARCGNPVARCGNFDRVIISKKDYIIPNDPKKWPYFAYIGGEKFPELAEIPSYRRGEFETLLLKIFPAHLWLGVLVKYI
jgi:hypothetical protein